MLVTEDAVRPAREDGTCFYCKQPIGDEHRWDCVLIKKKVLVNVTIGYEVSVPASWNKEDIEFHRNDSSWCADNLIQELEEYIEEQDICLCSAAEFTYVMDTSGPFLKEI